MTIRADPGRVAFRVDAGWSVGTGHVMRCLTLAEALAEAGFTSSFFCRAHEGHMAAAIAARGFGATLLPLDPAYAEAAGYEAWRGGSEAEDARLTAAAIAASGGADIVVVDHYALGLDFEREMRAHASGVVAFDDLGVVRHLCDVVIDQNIGHDPSRFDGLVPPEAARLVGADYAPLRPEFAAARPAALARRGELDSPRTLLISVGGADFDDVTGTALAALARRSEEMSWIERAHVVLTSSSRHLEAARRAAAAIPNVELHLDSRDMARLMAESDLAIGGSGVTAIERCVMGLPSLLVVMAENQQASADAIERFGAARTLGASRDLDEDGVVEALNAIHAHSDAFRAMISSAARLCDGLGLSRIVPVVVALGGRTAQQSLFQSSPTP